MKIGLVSAFDYSFHGGVTDHIRNLAGQLEAAGHDVVVFGPCSDTTRVPDNFVPMGRPVPIPSNGSIARVSVSVWLSPRIKQLLNREAFDIIHLHEPFSGFVPLNTLSVSETVNVATFHSYRSSHFFRIGGTALTNPYFRRIHGLIAVSKPARDFISQHFPGDYRTIPNGIQLEQFAGGAGPFPHLRDGMINLLFLGRLEKRKGLKYLLSAFSRLKWDWPNLRLIVVGPGKPDDDSYRIMSERNLRDVVFVGGVSEEEKVRYYRSADIYCSPATGRESFGIVLLEAMAAGRPIVASAHRGPFERHDRRPRGAAGASQERRGAGQRDRPSHPRPRSEGEAGRERRREGAAVPLGEGGGRGDGLLRGMPRGVPRRRASLTWCCYRRFPRALVA